MEYERVIRVEYRQPPYRDLIKTFGCVFYGFKGKTFEPIPLYRRVSLVTREVRLGLVKINRDTDTDQAFELIKSRGLRLGLYEELLAYGGSGADAPKSRIIALGSFCRDETTIEYAPFFDWLGNERFLFYSRYYKDWKAGDYFLVAA